MQLLRIIANVFYALKLSVYLFTLIIGMVSIFSGVNGLQSLFIEDDGLVTQFSTFASLIIFVYIIRQNWKARTLKLKLVFAIMFLIELFAFILFILSFGFTNDELIRAFFINFLINLIVLWRIVLWKNRKNISSNFNNSNTDASFLESSFDDFFENTAEKSSISNKDLDEFDYLLEEDDDEYSFDWFDESNYEDSKKTYKSPTLPHANERYYTGALRKQVMRKYNYRCTVCWTKDELEVDHIVPYSKGGKTTLENAQILCRWCNTSKGTRSQAEWQRTDAFQKRLAWRKTFKNKNWGRKHTGY